MKTSVAICTFNGEQFLNQQIDSILNQTCSVDEIIICDDLSTDSTISILNLYKEKHPTLFKIYINERNLRSVKNFEKAISLCKNEIIFLCDQDDIWVENKVERIVETFNSNPSISVICTNGFGINEKNEALNVIAVWDVPEMIISKGYYFDYFNILNLVDNFCTGASMAMRNNLKKEIFPFPIIDGLHHDKWIALVSVVKNNLFFLDEKLIHYRKHTHQQVGYVFHENNEKGRDHILGYFSVDKKKKTFKDFKQILKKISITYQKNQNLLGEVPAHKDYFISNLEELKKRFYIYNSEMNDKYPIKSKLLKITDQVMGKRKI